MSNRAVLACYAHPDDEQGVTGTLARYARAGVATGLVCATRGEMGEIADPALATPATLGAVREQELRCACATAGIARLWFLDYRDSGMAGTAPNQDAEAFINASPAEVIGKLAGIIRAFRPQVVLTFEPGGGYGHPDHVAISRWTVAACQAAGDAAQYPAAGPAWAPARLYYSSIPRSALQRMVDLARQRDAHTVFAAMDPSQMGLPDEAITNVVDVGDLIDLKGEALRCHATQLNPTSAWARLPVEVQRLWRAKEHFALVAGPPPPPGSDPGDLFAGLADDGR